MVYSEKQGFTVVKSAYHQEFDTEMLPEIQPGVATLTLWVFGEKKLVCGEGETSYKAVHAAFVQALKGLLPAEAYNPPNYAGDAPVAVATQEVARHFTKVLEDHAHRPCHHFGGTPTDREYRDDRPSHDEHGALRAASCHPA